MEEKKLNESIIKIRVELQKMKLQKTGKNKFAGFEYYELADFLPRLNELMLEEKINDVFTIENEEAKLILKKSEETQEYKMPFVLFDTPINKKYNKDFDEYVDVKSMQDIQYLGALNTYYKRYLYINAFGITDGDIIDGLPTDEETPSKPKEKEKKEVKATPKQIEILAKVYKDENLAKLLNANGIDKLEDLSIKKASDLIQKITEKKEGTKENE